MACLWFPVEKGEKRKSSGNPGSINNQIKKKIVNYNEIKAEVTKSNSHSSVLKGTKP